MGLYYTFPVFYYSPWMTVICDSNILLSKLNVPEWLHFFWVTTQSYTHNRRIFDQALLKSYMIELIHDWLIHLPYVKLVYRGYFPLSCTVASFHWISGRICGWFSSLAQNCSSWCHQRLLPWGTGWASRSRICPVRHVCSLIMFDHQSWWVTGTCSLWLNKESCWCRHWESVCWEDVDGCKCSPCGCSHVVNSRCLIFCIAVLNLNIFVRTHSMIYVTRYYSTDVMIYQRRVWY